jgi:proteic killer suppression protein
MKVVFRDERLALVETERAAAETGLPIAVIAACRKKLVFLRAATDERDLRNWKSLRFEKLDGQREGQRSIRLNDQWRLIFVLDDSVTPASLEVLEVADYH